MWDEQMMKLYGVDEINFTGAYEAWRSGLHPDDVERGDREIQMAISGEKDFNTEFRVIWPDGSVRNIRALATVLRDESGKATRMIGTNWDITIQKQMEEKIKEISIRDPLTNVFNRRHLFERLEAILMEYLRENKSFTVSIIDIDHFKNINDRYGHQAGDFILKELTCIINENLRTYDLLGRYGGEEFIIITINSNKNLTRMNIERIRDIVKNKTFRYNESDIKLTFSCGISECIEHEIESISIEKIIETADKRLYEAKKTGRDKIVI
jgi:diguanylate cyclase (GGDEF)-like protein/PAS domain S-box-containing protein